MSLIYFKSNVLIETAVAGVYESLTNVTQVKHYGISPTRTAENNPNDIPEVPYVMISCSGNANIIKGRHVIAQYKTAAMSALLAAASYSNIFKGEITYLDDLINYRKGQVVFDARNALSQITADFFGSQTDYGTTVTLAEYDSATKNYRIPSTIQDVYAVYSNDIEVSDNNWVYDYLMSTISFFRAYSDSSTITLSGHTDQQLKTIVEALLASYDFDAVTDSATPLMNLSFPGTLSIFRALRQIAWIYNYRLFADMDGNICFNPIKINTDAETLTLADTDGTVTKITQAQAFKTITKAEVYGKLLKVNAYNRYENILDDFNENGNGNNYGGYWEIYSSSALNTVSPAVGHFSAQYERGNLGAKLYADIVTGYVKLYCTLNNDGTTEDLSAYTSITVKYRCTSPLYIYVDNAYYKLPAVGVQIERTILFSAFTGTITAAAITNIAFVIKDTGVHEFFIDYVEFYPAAAVEEQFAISEKQLSVVTGTSGGIISVNLSWVVRSETLQDVADSLYAYYAGGLDQYDINVNCPAALAEVGDIVKLTSAEHSLTAQPFEVLALDWEITPTNFFVTYATQTAYLLTDLTKIRQNDIGSSSAYFTTTAAEGTGTATQVTFNREAETLSGQSRFNYEIVPPSMSIYSVTGSGTSTIITFNTKLGKYDADFFKVSRFEELGLVSASGTGTTIILTFSRPIDSIDADFFRALQMSIFGFVVNSASGTEIEIEFDRPLVGVDADYFTVQQFT